VTALADLVIDRPAVSQLLEHLGVDLTHSLASAMVLATADVLLAVELGEALPPEADYAAALDQLTSFAVGALPPPARVTEVQWTVLDRLMQGEDAPVVDAGRLAQLHERLQALSV
jgi:hypothetical protein